MSTETPPIWRLHVRANDYRSFAPDDLRFFWGKFCCERLSETWEVPPVAVLGLSKPVGDFMAWANSAPVVSERARAEIEHLDKDAVEFLPFHSLGRRKTYVANVLRCCDYLDRERSDLNDFNDQYFFRSDIPRSLPPIFKCEGAYATVFVSKAFGEMVVTARLRGIALADPAEHPMPLILARADLNRFPGIPD